MGQKSPPHTVASGLHGSELQGLQARGSCSCHPLGVVASRGSAPAPPAAHTEAAVPSWHQNLAAPGPRPEPRAPREAPGPSPAGQTSSPRLPSAPGFASWPWQARLYSSAHSWAGQTSGWGRGRHLAGNSSPPLSIVWHNHTSVLPGSRGHFLEGSRKPCSHLAPLSCGFAPQTFQAVLGAQAETFGLPGLGP